MRNESILSGNIASTLSLEKCKIAYMSLAKRISEIRSAMSLNKVQFGKLAGVSHAAVGEWENGKTKSLKHDTLTKLEKNTGYSATWINSGKGPKFLAKEPNQGYSPNLNVDAAHSRVRKIPLISYTQAGEWGDAVDPYGLNDAEDWINAPEDVGERCFYLWVKGVSMEPDYPEGGMILVDPDIDARHGDDVVVRTPDGKVTFKCYQDTPDGKHLLARNKNYRPQITEIPEGTIIVGVVTDYTRKVGRFRK